MCKLNRGRTVRSALSHLRVLPEGSWYVISTIFIHFASLPSSDCFSSTFASSGRPFEADIVRVVMSVSVLQAWRSWQKHERVYMAGNARMMISVLAEAVVRKFEWPPRDRRPLAAKTP